MLKYWTDHSKGYIQGLVAVTALTLGFRIVFKSTKTFTTSGFAELRMFLKLLFTVNKGPRELRGLVFWSCHSLVLTDLEFLKT